MKQIYLCGPIMLCTDAEAKDWRAYCKKRMTFTDHHINLLDPMVRDYRDEEAAVYREIVELDKNDVRRSDIILANCTKPSAGTSMELFYAHQLGKINVVVASDPVSPWVRYHATHLTNNLDEAIDWILETGLTAV